MADFERKLTALNSILRFTLVATFIIISTANIVKKQTEDISSQLEEFLSLWCPL